MPTLSVYGDVHIPDNLIHALGLKPGTELAFERQGDAIIMKSVDTNILSWFPALRHCAQLRFFVELWEWL